MIRLAGEVGGEAMSVTTLRVVKEQGGEHKKMNGVLLAGTTVPQTLRSFVLIGGGMLLDVDVVE